MRIDSLRIQNFRCFEEQIVRFAPDLSVLIGLNGSGKTATLEALAIAAGTWLAGIKGYRAPGIRRSDVRLVGRAYHGETTYEEQYPVQIEAKGSVLDENHIRWCRELSSSRGRARYAEAKQLVSLAEKADATVRKGGDITLPVVAYYGAGRLWERLRDTERRHPQSEPGGDAKRETSRLVGYRDSMDRRTNARDFARWLQRQDHISYQRGEQTLFYRMVRKATAGMLEEVVDIRYDKDRTEVVAEFDDEYVIPFSMLSDGQRNILALAGDLAVRMIRLNLPLGERALEETPGIVLIDEIDLHLHPAWQRHIIGDLRRTFPKVQFITTTHSPQVIGEVPPQHIIILTEQGPQHPERSYGLDSNAVLETVMGAESQNEGVDASVRSIISAIQRKDLSSAEREVADLRKMLREEHGVAYDPPELRRAEAMLQRVRIIGR